MEENKEKLSLTSIIKGLNPVMVLTVIVCGLMIGGIINSSLDADESQKFALPAISTTTPAELVPTPTIDHNAPADDVPVSFY